MEGFRFDLDDVNGEVIRLDWKEDERRAKSQLSQASAPVRNSRASFFLANQKLVISACEQGAPVMGYGPSSIGMVNATLFIEGRNGSKLSFMQRSMRMGSNPFVAPIPELRIHDPVGRDIADIPVVCRRIQEDWAEPSSSLNRLSAFTLLSKLRKRLLMHQLQEHDQAVDLLITGCEVSLWVGEQFASDLHNAFPQLRVITISANKLLGQLGQAFPVPNTGFCACLGAEPPY